MQQISSLWENLSFLDKIILNKISKINLKWWVQNVKLRNGRALIQPSAEVLIQTDASVKGWEATCNGISTGRMWSAQEMKKPHECLRTFSHKTGYTNILENHEAQSHSSPVGQHGSFDIPIKYSGNP